MKNPQKKCQHKRLKRYQIGRGVGGGTNGISFINQFTWKFREHDIS